jgi:hypothetical protein
VRRHDLHAVLVEDVLHVAVEDRQHFGARQRPARDRLADEPVLDVEILERGLEHARLRIGQHASRPARRLDQHRVHLPPRGVVTDRHRRIENESLALDGARIVARHR